VAAHETETTCFTLADGTPSDAIAAAYRAALLVLRPRLADLSIALISDGPWPAEAEHALQSLKPRTVRTRPMLRPWVTETGYHVDLDPRDDTDIEHALSLVPWTINAEGIADDQSIAYSVNDSGTSAAFELTPAEHAELTMALADKGVDPRCLVALPRRRKTFS
jgi:hypothetical protein